MGFPRKEYQSGLLFPSPGDLPNPEIKPQSPAWQLDSLPLSHQGSSYIKLGTMLKTLCIKKFSPLPQSLKLTPCQQGPLQKWKCRALARSEEINFPLLVGLLPQPMVNKCFPGRLQPPCWLHLVPRSETALCGIVSPEQRLLLPHPAMRCHEHTPSLDPPHTCVQVPARNRRWQWHEETVKICQGGRKSRRQDCRKVKAAVPGLVLHCPIDFTSRNEIKDKITNNFKMVNGEH